MYVFALTLHSWLRWIVLIAGFIALVQAYRAWLQPSAAPVPAGTKSRSALAFLVSTDLQLLLGLALYFLSPVVGTARASMGAAMRDSVLRFWAVEHALLMVVGVVLVHVGFARAKKAADTVARGRRAAIPFTIALVCFLAASPWPWMLVGRPLFRT